MSLFKSAIIVGFGTLLSRIVGYVRDICIAYFLGVGALADALFVALRLPNCFRSLFAEGAFNSAFVPMFSGKLATEGKVPAVEFASHIFSFMTIVLFIFSSIVMLFMPYVTMILAPGFKDAEQFRVTVELSRIAFPYLLLVSLVALQSGVLNSLGSFGPPAITSVLLNLCMILSLFTLTDITGSSAHALAYGMTISGVIQFIWLFFSNYRIGVILKFSVPKIDQDVSLLLKKMVPGIIGSSATQLNLVINTMLATLVPGGVSYLYYSDRLVQFPMAIIGTAMGTALLPLLSKQFKLNDTEAAIKSQNRGLVFAMLFTIPSALALAVIANPLIDLMFQRGQFSDQDVAATANALIAYTIGLPAFVLVKIFAPGFFATQDTKTPVKIALASIVLNILISLIFMGRYGYIAMALGTSLASTLNAGLLGFILYKRGLFRFERGVLTNIAKITLAAILMAVVLLLLQQYMAVYLAEISFKIRAICVLILIISGIFSFFVILWVFRFYKISELFGSFNRRF